MRKSDLQENFRALGQLGQTVTALSRLQDELLGQSSDVTRQMNEMFDLLEQRGSRAEQLLISLNQALSMMSQVTRDISTLSEVSAVLSQSEKTSTQVSSMGSTSSSTTSPSQSQLRNFFTTAVRRGFGGS